MSCVSVATVFPIPPSCSRAPSAARSPLQETHVLELVKSAQQSIILVVLTKSLGRAPYHKNACVFESGLSSISLTTPLSLDRRNRSSQSVKRSKRGANPYPTSSKNLIWQANRTQPRRVQGGLRADAEVGDVLARVQRLAEAP